MSKTGVKLAEVSVGNRLTTDVMMSPSTGIPKQTSIMDQESRPVCLGMQATIPTDLCMLNSILPIYAGLYGNPHSRAHAYGWGTEKVADIACGHVAELDGARRGEAVFAWGAAGLNNMSIKYGARFYKSKKHIITSQTAYKCVLDLCRQLQDEGYDITIKNNCLINLEHSEKDICPDTSLVSIMTVNNEIEVIQQMQVGTLYREQGAFFLTIGKIRVAVAKWDVDWMSISDPKVDGPRGIGACYIGCRLGVRMDPLISNRGQEHGLRSEVLTPLFAIGLGEARRIAPEEIEYTRTFEPFFSLNSICSSTVRNNYIHKGYHNKQSKQFTRTLRTMSHNKEDKKGMCKATDNASRAEIREANLTEVPNTKESRNRKFAKSYSRITIREAEDRLGLRLNIPGVPLERILEGKRGSLGPDSLLKLKRKIYQNLVDNIESGGYPTEADADFKEADINDIVAATIRPVIAQFRRETKRDLHLAREKEITSKDFSTGGVEEFVVMDYISYNRMEYVLVVEAKKASLGEAVKQCFLSLKDMWDSNDGGTVYGFITQGDSWRMISFDGTFKLSKRIDLLFDDMGEKEEEWMADYSILVECLDVALTNGGKDPIGVV
ncbi:pyridoxal phosphate-dependent transferase [Tuber indicum]|nr:pyridoxal phosphate-dependent transferase [Tuber indicum]